MTNEENNLESSLRLGDEELLRSVYEQMDRQSMFTGYNPWANNPVVVEDSRIAILINTKNI